MTGHGHDDQQAPHLDWTRSAAAQAISSNDYFTRQNVQSVWTKHVVSHSKLKLSTQLCRACSTSDERLSTQWTDTVEQHGEGCSGAQRTESLPSLRSCWCQNGHLETLQWVVLLSLQMSQSMSQDVTSFSRFLLVEIMTPDFANLQGGWYMYFVKIASDRCAIEVWTDCRTQSTMKTPARSSCSSFHRNSF